MGVQRTFFFLVLFALPLFISSYSQPFSENLRDSFYSITKPIFSFGESVSQSVGDAVGSIKKFFLVYQENEKLKREVDFLEKRIVDLQEAEKENQRLQNLLEFKKKSPSRAVACQVIARDVTHLSNWAVLNKGLKDGVKKEMPVVTEEGLIGKVVEVSSRTARAVLLTDLECRVSGMVQSTRDTGLVTGEGGPFLKMKFIDLDSNVKVGDLVVTSGLGDVYPKGILIGKVESIGREKNGLHLYARLKPGVSFSKAEEVMCLDYQPSN